MRGFNAFLIYLLIATPLQAKTIELSRRNILATGDTILESTIITDFKKNLSVEENTWLAQRNTIRVGVVSPLTPPMEFLTSGNKLEGISADILSILEELTEKHISIQHFESSEQALVALQHKQIDMLTPSSLLPGAPLDEIGSFSQKMFFDDYTVLAGFTSKRPSAEPTRIAYESGGLMDKELLQAYPQAVLQPYTNIMDAFDAVHFGQADLFLGSNSTVTYLNSTRLSNLVIKERTKIQCASLKFFISHDNQPLRSIINGLLTIAQKSALTGLITLRWRGGSLQTSSPLLDKMSIAAKEWLMTKPMIRVGLISDDFPFSFINTDGQWQGIVVDILNAISRRSKIRFEMMSYNSIDSMHESILEGDLDMMGSVLGYQHHPSLSHSMYYNTDDFLVMISSLDQADNISTIALSSKHAKMLSPWLNVTKKLIKEVGSDIEAIKTFEQMRTHHAILPLYLAEYYESVSERPYHILGRVGPISIERSFAIHERNLLLQEIINEAIASISPAALSDIAYYWRTSPLPPVGFYAQYAGQIKTFISIALPLLVLWAFYSYRIHQELRVRKKLESELSGQLDLMQEVLDGLPHPVLLVREDGVIHYHNKALSSLLKQPSNGLKGIHVSYVIDRGNENVFNVIDSVIKGMNMFSRDSSINISGNSIDIQEWFVPYKILHDGSKGVLWGWFDITWRNEMYHQLALSKRDAESANKAKSEFIATISHEIRTPINIINGFLALTLGRHTLSDIDREELEYARSAANGLLCLVGDVLDVTKIESGLLSLEPSDINANDVLHDIIAMFSTIAKENNTQLILKSELQNHLVKLDPLRTKQILFNIIGNAVKFTHDGIVTVSAWETDKKIRFNITDTGIGIEDDKLDSLFQPFVQVHNVPGYQGSGLGLNISKRLCELMGGGISISSKKGKGTEVEIALPYQSVDIINFPDDQEILCDIESFPLTDVHLLIVDDHPVNLVLLRRRLALLGFSNIYDADNGWQALDIVRSETIHIIITDCQMLGMDGFTLVEALRKYEIDSGCARHVILGLTASGLKQDREKGIAAGMDACMFKPIDSSSLYSEITSHFHQLDIAEFDKEGSCNAISLRHVSFMKMVTDSTTEDIELARKALLENDIEMLGFLIHRIKGVFLTIKHDDIINCCKDIERHLVDGTHTQQIIASLDRIQDLMRTIINED